MQGLDWGVAIAITAAVAVSCRPACAAAAFGRTTTHHRPSTASRSPSSSSSSRLRSSASTSPNGGPDRSQRREEREDHPHSRAWRAILDSAPGSRVHPSVELAIRPPSEGGTGIVATDDIPADAVALRLPLDEVGIIDAASVLGSYHGSGEEGGGDTVLTMLKETCRGERASSTKIGNEGEEGKRLAVLAGIVSHLQLTRFKDVNSRPINDGSSYALEQSRRLGPFLDAMPLLPRHPRNVGRDGERENPLPTHFLYWTDDEVQHLLGGTMAQTKARELRASVGLVVREWSASFLREHSDGVSQGEILNGILSAFAAVLSRSFNDAAGREPEGRGRILVPIVDMLNHDSEDPNVSWALGGGGGENEDRGRGCIVVKTLRRVKGGEELLKRYGRGPAWDIAGFYGFVPALRRERRESAVLPLFPAVLDLAPGSMPAPVERASGRSLLDLTLESNYGPLVEAVIAAMDAANDVSTHRRRGEKAVCEGGNTTGERDEDEPTQTDCPEVVRLFRPPPTLTADEFPFPRRQPCIVVGTTIRADGPGGPDGPDGPSCGDDRLASQIAVESILPAFRAAASAISQLRDNHSRGVTEAVDSSRMAAAAATTEASVDWDGPALELAREGIEERIRTLEEGAREAKAWLAARDAATADGGDCDDISPEQRRLRAGVARDARDAELMVLHALQIAIHNW